MPALFSPLKVGPFTVPNRIVVAPMCQYLANDGCMNDWHLQHLMTLAMSGAGTVVIEASGVERRGRITHGCTGLYDDACEAAMGRVLDAARRVAAPGTRFVIQLGHAGRKASAQRPWEGGRANTDRQDPWPTIGPTDVPHDRGWHRPRAMTEVDMAAVTDAFVASTLRALRLGFDGVELHLAHGYLLQQFLSPVSNTRGDAFGGDLKGRMRFPLAVAGAVRKAIPAGAAALGARLSGSDYLDGGWDMDQTLVLAWRLADIGLDYLCLSGGGPAGMKPPVGPGYQVPFARAVRENVGIVTRAVGMVLDGPQANAIIADGAADLVALARPFLDDPRWVWRVAASMGVDMHRPPAYQRVAPELWPGHGSRRL